MPAQTLRDGTVIPSFLSIAPAGRRGNPGNQTNMSLRWGEVVAISYPTDSDNINKQVNEYTVKVQHKDRNKSMSTVTYNNVQLMNMFGGFADVLKYTLRVAPASPAPAAGNLGTGAKVLLLCANGNKHEAVIIGGLRDLANDGNQDKQGDGHNLAFTFNGINIVIDQNGQLIATFNGATNIDGTLTDDADPDAQGSTFSMLQDGSLALMSPDMNTSVVIDASNAQLNLTGSEEVDVNSTGNIVLQSAGVLTGGATDATLLGSTYRMNEQIMNTEIETLADTISGLFDTAGGTLTTAGPLITTAGALNIIPMVGGILAAVPFASAGVAIAAAGAAMTAAGAAMTAWGVAITVFEQTNDITPYLSSVNYSD
jgi:hypothetical protein